MPFEKGNEWRIPPGQSGNPSGRNGYSVMKEEFEAMLSARLGEQGAEGKTHGREFIECFVELAKRNPTAAAALWDRVAGKVTQSIRVEKGLAEFWEELKQGGAIDSGGIIPSATHPQDPQGGETPGNSTGPVPA